jgi:Endodeoxyribonuclease RusA
MLSITSGSIVSGSTGKKYKVDRVEGDFIYSGKIKIKRDLILQVESPSLIDRLSTIATLDKPDAIEGLTDLLGEFTADDIYHTSLSIDTFPGIFVRRWLADVEAIAELLTQSRPPSPIDKAEVSIAIGGKQRGDLDNIAGAILDALVQSGILIDDRISVVSKLSIEHSSKLPAGASIDIS